MAKRRNVPKRNKLPKPENILKYKWVSKKIISVCSFCGQNERWFHAPLECSRCGRLDQNPIVQKIARIMHKRTLAYILKTRPINQFEFQLLVQYRENVNIFFNKHFIISETPQGTLEGFVTHALFLLELSKDDYLQAIMSQGQSDADRLLVLIAKEMKRIAAQPAPQMKAKLTGKVN